MSRFRLLALLPLAGALGGCVGAVIGTTADVAIEVAKIPFKVGGAVIDVAIPDDDDDDEKTEAEPAPDADGARPRSDAATH